MTKVAISTAPSRKWKPAMFNAVLSLIPPSGWKEIGSILLLLGLAGEVSVAVVKITNGALNKALAIIFGVLVLAGVGLEYWSDSPRTLSSNAQHRLTQALKPFPETPFDFSVNLDPESVNLMEAIASALEASGWKRQSAVSFGFINPGKPTAGIVAFAGLEIQISDSRQAEWGADGKAAAVLWHSLQEEGLTTSAKHLPNEQESPNAIHIKIGAKP